MNKKLISFTKLQEKDLTHRVKWLNNPRINKFIGDELEKTTNIIKEKTWFENYKKYNDKKFFIVNCNKKPVGVVGLSNISTINKNSDLFLVIGEDDYVGKGIGKIAVNYILKYGFLKLKLHKINLGVLENNVIAVNLYKKIGFEIEGIMKEEVFCNGKFENFFSMAIFYKKWILNN